jgi:hypothetical protein
VADSQAAVVEIDITAGQVQRLGHPQAAPTQEPEQDRQQDWHDRGRFGLEPVAGGEELVQLASGEYVLRSVRTPVRLKSLTK